MNKVIYFFDSVYYLIFIFIISALSWYFYLNEFVLIVYAIICSIIFLFKLKTEYLMPVIFNGMFVCRSYISMDTIPISFLIFGLVFLGSLGFYIVKTKPNIMKPKMKISFLLLSISSILSLVFLETNGQSIRYLLSIINVAFMLIYIFFSSTSSKNQGFYLARSIVGLGCLLSFEYLISGITLYGFDSKIIALGWGGANTLAIYLNIAIIFAFYLLSQSSRFITFLESIFLISVFTFVLLLTQSRTGYLAFLVCIIPLAAFTLFKAKEKKYIAISYSIIALSIFVFGIIFMDEFVEIIQLAFRNGFADNGRFEMWNDALHKFRIHPIFGNGLFNVNQINSPDPNRLSVLHNLIVQCLYSFGILGLIALLYFYYEECRVIFSKLTTFKVFVLIVLLSGFIHGMLDNTFYMGVYMVVLCSILSVMENDEQDIIAFRNNKK